VNETILFLHNLLCGLRYKLFSLAVYMDDD